MNKYDDVAEPDPDIPVLDADVTPDRTDPYAGFDENWWNDHGQRIRAMSRCAYWTFVPHSENNATRKVVTSVLMVTWASITLGVAFGFAESGDFYGYMTALVFAIVCSIWGFELGVLDSEAKIRQRTGDDDDD